MEFVVLGLFVGVLLICVALDISVLAAMVAGLILFLGYGRLRRFPWRALGQMVWSGVRTVRNILITFLLIGMLTALWRCCGTIPVIVCYAARLIRPEIFVLLAYLLNCLVSVLTGTSFGTAATMGVICMTISDTMGLPPSGWAGPFWRGPFSGTAAPPCPPAPCW